MKLHLYITIVFCSILLISCGEEAPKKDDASAEQTSIEMPAKNKQEEEKSAVKETETGKDNVVASNDVQPNDTKSLPSKTKGSQNFDPNSNKSFYDKNTSKGGPVIKNSDGTNVKINPKKGGVPKMIFKDETYNFGTVEQGEDVTFSFEFTNTGTGDLVISNAKAACGCTEPSFSFLPISPKAKSSIDVTFRTAGREGMQRKSVTITSNSYPKVRKVYLEGRVTKTEVKEVIKEEVKEEVKEVIKQEDEDQ
jgi:hypothetical protein